MRLADLELSPRQATEFLSWLDARADAADRAAVKEADVARAEAYNERCSLRLAELARDTAHQSGPVVGVRDYDLARAAWAAFIDCEGWHCMFDVDEHWNPDEGDAEAWEHAYVGELEKMRQERG
jgi:hypothetical protein